MRRSPVFFVGAGPGDPELITVKGRILLNEADLVLYTGSLIPRALIDGLKAEIIDSSSLTLNEIIDNIYSRWNQGKRVVRLHTGDPSIYGAINEQMAALDELSIPYKIVPGVSSACAVAASLKTELTVPETSQTVIITRRRGKTPVPETEDLKKLASHKATMLIFLSVSMIEEVVAELVKGGYPEATPASVVEKASWPGERIIRGSLANISSLVRNAGIRKTAIICVGEVFGEKKQKPASKLYNSSFSHGFRNAKS